MLMAPYNRCYQDPGPGGWGRGSTPSLHCLCQGSCFGGFWDSRPEKEQKWKVPGSQSTFLVAEPAGGASIHPLLLTLQPRCLEKPTLGVPALDHILGPCHVPHRLFWDIPLQESQMHTAPTSLSLLM
jgi:hypothetical protein